MKTKRRLYLKDAFFAPGAVLSLPPEAAHYLLNVLRLGVGDEVHVFNETGEWRGAVQAAKKQNLHLLLQSQTRAAMPPPRYRLTLAFAPLKKDRTDFLVEKASELGIHTLQPVITDHTQSERVNTERLTATAIEAAEQCDRLDAPQVLAPLKLQNYLESLPQGAVLFLAAERGDAAPIAGAFSPLSSLPSHIHFLIGPEGGFSDREFEIFDRLPAICRLRLGPRLLRAETAAVAVLSAFQAIEGDWT